MSVILGIGSLGDKDSNGESSLSSNTLSRRIRPPPINTSSLEEGRVPLRCPKIQRKESKGGLRGMFSRNKPEKNVVSPVPEGNKSASPLTSPTPLSPKLMSPITSPVGDGFFRKFGAGNTTDLTSPTTPATPGNTTGTPSRLNLRSKSAKDSKTAAKPAPKTSPKATVFDPPPLFQSYPQSVKHARLSASTLSADAIIRMSNHKRNISLRDEIAQTTETGPDEKKTVIKHDRRRSGSISKGEWTQKIFVLVTSGYLLQYSGDGNFDRLPEKMIQLGKESVAFASDVIPGKHWVLQVSQSMSADGVPTSDSRSLLSRLAFRSADYRRNATSLLLVLDSAEEMDSWIAVLRKEIETLGGKKQITEIGTVKTDEKTPELKSQPSHRYLVQRRGSDQVSNPCSPPQNPYDRRPSWQQQEGQIIGELALPWSTPRERRASWQKPEGQNIDKTSPTGFLPPWSLNEAQNEASIRPLTGCGSVTNSASSYEQNLEGLRDSINRLSYCSSDQRTRISSPATSPARDSTSTMEDLPPLSLETVRVRPNAADIVERRRSLQALQGSRDPIPQISPHLQTPQQTLRHSNYGTSTRVMRSPSPATPNFSVPVSSSKRFSTRSPVPERRPSLPAMNTTVDAEKRSKKGPPTALSVARPLSPVMDTTSPKRVPIPVTSMETSHRPVALNKSSTVDTRPRFPGKSPIKKRQSKELRSTRRVSSFMPSNNALEVRNKDLRRHSSMQAVGQTTSPLESNGSCASKFPEPLSPKLTHDESFENIRESDCDSLPTLQESSLQAQPLPTLPEIPIKQNPQRRPRSMLASSGHQSTIVEDLSNTPRRKRPSSLAPTTLSPTLIYKASHSDLGPPRFRSGRSVSSKRSLPALMHGAPPAPPPDCALPPLPPGSATTTSRKSPSALVNSRREIGVRV
ncbi:hypothetical protein OCU04_002064 [Sclerotinia nivalis]|uniref:PH domain-containing protein n=1 Tax=Sclerotinia nivalis TaxID=352851 RepID=A0A9X0DS46_9HELO|nr:hypothetical protein OCU04_002064 [Sclerotinia nivalis]